MNPESFPEEIAITPDQRWIKMLNEYLPPADIRLPINPGILNIGCGNSVKWNYLALTIYLAQEDLGLPNYIGVDVNEEAFADAKETLGDLVHFVAGDAQNLTTFLKGQYHLALFEHPALTISRDGPRQWLKIFQETSKLLDNDGGVILTSFWLNDHIPAQVGMERAGFTIVHSGRNKFPGKTFDTASNGESLQFDKYILIAKKTS